LPVARSSKKGDTRHVDRRADAADIARYGIGTTRTHVGAASVPGQLELEATDALLDEERRVLRRKVRISVAALVVLAFLSIGIIGHDGSQSYLIQMPVVFSPLDILRSVYEHIYNFLGPLTHLWNAHNQSWIAENVPAYTYIGRRAGVIGITLICAVLLSVSGMLYQNVFRNPIAGPGMLGATSGVSLGMVLLVVVYGLESMSMLKERYIVCYGLGALIIAFVVLAGKRLSGKGKPFDIINMLLIGAIFSQFIGFAVSYLSLYVLPADVYETYLTLTQMLVVDTSLLSWAVLGVATLVSIVPVYLLRFKLNGLAFNEIEVKLFGINITLLRGIALVCGAIMILAAQIHVGAVALVSLIVPFLSRSWFGCEFSKQFVGNICISTILLLACRDLADLIPFVGAGVAIGSVVSIVALPLFIVIMAKQMRGWD